jgi:hypothetical protein
LAHFEYPRSIPAERLSNARLAPNLEATLGAVRPGSVVAEIGVRLGDFTEMLLRQSAVAKLFAIDHFNLHAHKRSADGVRLNGAPHLDFFRERFSKAVKSERLETRIGRLDAIKALPPGSVNAFFIRGCRDFTALTNELYMCDAKLRPQGMLWIADYIMADYTNGESYDTVRAVNEFVVKNPYDFNCLVLEGNMFCSVVLRRQL